MINKPTSDFVSTTFDVALAQGETGAITAKIGTGLLIPATNSFLQVDYNSSIAVGTADGPETIFYATYTSGTGALTGVVRGQAGTTDVAHSAGAEVQCGMSTAFLEDNTGWKTVKDTWAYASASTITVPTGAASVYSVGDKIRLVQAAATKYFYVTAVADTVLTVTGGTDYTVANAAITANYYSKSSSPVGFPANSNTFSPLGVAYAQITSAFSSTTVAGVDITGLTITITVPTGKRIRITSYSQAVSNSAAAGTVVSMNIREGAANIAYAQQSLGANGVTPFYVAAILSPTAGSHTYKMLLAAASAGTMVCNASADSPAYIFAEIV
jgi:hypothetical protein